MPTSMRHVAEVTSLQGCSGAGYPDELWHASMCHPAGLSSVMFTFFDSYYADHGRVCTKRGSVELIYNGQLALPNFRSHVHDHGSVKP